MIKNKRYRDFKMKNNDNIQHFDISWWLHFQEWFIHKDDTGLSLEPLCAGYLHGKDYPNLARQEKLCYTMRTWTNKTFYRLLCGARFGEFCLCSCVYVFRKRTIKPYCINIQKLWVALTDNFCKSTWHDCIKHTS